MGPVPGAPPPRDQTGVDRIVYFSDAVFAIAITLLVLNIRLPSNLREHEVPHALASLGPRYFSFGLTFLVIGAKWMAHHRTFRHVRAYDETMIFLNLLLLLTVAFLPFPSYVLGAYGDGAAATIFYAASMTVSGLLATALWINCSRGHRLIDPDLSPHTIRYYTGRGLALTVVFGLSIPVAVFAPRVAQGLWLLTFIVQRGLSTIHRRRLGSDRTVAVAGT
jgi:uncharacterized membrane protein